MKPKIDGLIQNIFATNLGEFDEGTERVLFGKGDVNGLSSLSSERPKEAIKEDETQSSIQS